MYKWDKCRIGTTTKQVENEEKKTHIMTQTDDAFWQVRHWSAVRITLAVVTVVFFLWCIAIALKTRNSDECRLYAGSYWVEIGAPVALVGLGTLALLFFPDKDLRK